MIIKIIESDKNQFQGENNGAKFSTTSWIRWHISMCFGAEPAFRLSRLNVRSFLGAILDIFRCDCTRQGSHKNAYTEDVCHYSIQRNISRVSIY